MPGTARTAFVAALLAAGLLAAARPAAAARVTLIGSLSHSAAIAGDATTGGAAFELGFLAGVRGPLSAGLIVHFDDMGEQVGQLVGEGGENLGSSQQLHVATVGWGARVDARLNGLRVPGSTILTGSTGIYSVGKDQLGENLDRMLTWGWSVGGSWRLPVRKHLDFGPMARYHRLQTSDEMLKHYWLFGLEGAWH